MKWFKKSYFFVFFIAITYVISSSNGLCSDVATRQAFAHEKGRLLEQNLSEVYVIPGGNTIGIKLYTDGVLVVDTTEFESISGEIVNPAEKSGIRPGDIIFAVNGEKVSESNEIADLVSASDEKQISLSLSRNGNLFDVNIVPCKEKESKESKLGIWIRDSAAGIGTLTFVRTDNKKFAALGHGITDRDLREKYSVKTGSIEIANVMSVKKSEQGVPGELEATFGGNGKDIGVLERNLDCGIFGSINSLPEGEKMKVATRWQIKEGPAVIRCSLDRKKVEEFDIVIDKIMLGGNFSTKSMVIKVTDQELIKRTGGIVQGMSGSPIIQDGKLVGAVTHVFVNDPTKGYGIFIENMLSETEKIK